MALGGSYIIGKDGVRRLVAATADHPEGNCARDADGQPLQARAVDAQAKSADAGASKKKSTGDKS